MGSLEVNSEGVPISAGGYVLCTKCRKDVTDLSREVRLEYAKCVLCRRNCASAVVKTQKGDGKMDGKSKSYREPASKVKELLSHVVVTREDMVAKMESVGYKKSTIQAQLFNLRHWPGCIVTDDGYRTNPDFVQAEKPAKKKQKTKSEQVSSGVRAVPKPSRSGKGRKKAA